MHPASPHIAIVAGEASGDALGAGLVHALRQRYPGGRFSAVAGPRMRAQGVEVLARIESLSVMGLAEVVAHLPRLLALRARLVRELSRLQPDVVVGIDSPDFNLPLERTLRKRGIKTVHYVSPSVWAWRPGRVKTVARAADLLLCLLPFEPDFYTGVPVSVRYVGHPLADAIPMHTEAKACRAALGLEATATMLALLPGSRVSEVARLAGPFLETAHWIAQRTPGLVCVVPLAGTAAAEAFREQLRHLDGSLDVRTVEGRSQEVMGAADAVLLASGTATLEALLLKRPMVVAYSVSGITSWLLGNMGLLKTQYVSLPNLLAGEEIVEECLQQRAVPEVMGPAMLRLLQQPEVRAAQLGRFTKLHEELRCDADVRAAAAIAGLMESP